MTDQKKLKVFYEQGKIVYERAQKELEQLLQQAADLNITTMNTETTYEKLQKTPWLMDALTPEALQAVLTEHNSVRQTEFETLLKNNPAELRRISVEDPARYNAMSMVYVGQVMPSASADKKVNIDPAYVRNFVFSIGLYLNGLRTHFEKMAGESKEVGTVRQFMSLAGEIQQKENSINELLKDESW